MVMVMAKKWRTYLGISFLAITEPFWADWADSFMGSQGTIIHDW